MFNQKPMLGQLPDWTRFPQPAALYVMNEGTGSIINDLSGNGQVGSLVADTHWVPGRLGHALSFDGTGDYVQITNKNPCFTGGLFRNSTIIFWFKANNVTDGTKGIVSCSSSIISTTPALLIQQNTSTIRFYNLSVGYWGAFTIEAGKWYQVAFVNDGVNDHAYINGIYINSIAQSATTKDTTYLYFGTGYNGQFNGQISNGTLFSSALTVSQIRQLYIDPFPWFRREPAIKLWTPPEDGGIVVLRRRRECA